MARGRAEGSIGPLRVIVEHDEGALAGRLLDELGPRRPDDESGDREADLLVSVGEVGELTGDPAMVIYSARDHFAFGPRDYRWDDPVHYRVADLFDPARPTRLFVRPGSERSNERWRGRLGRGVGFHPALSYSLLWYVAHATLLKRRATFVHAAAGASSESRFLIAGTGGSGKTTLVMHLVGAGIVRYVAEDFGIVDGQGRVWPSPKSLSVYSSDAVALGWQIRRISSGWSAADRARWWTHRALGRNPVARVPLADVAIEPVPPAPLTSAIFLVRCGGSSIDCAPLDATEFARRCTAVIFREQHKLVEALQLINANVPDGWPYPSVEDVTQATHTVIESAVATARLTMVRAPARATASDIAAAVIARGLLGT